MNLPKKLTDFDREIEASLAEPYKQIEEKSKALASSLRRCFQEAQNSGRFAAAYKAGQTGLLKNIGREALLQKFNADFEEADYMSFREFVRLLRACSLHIGGKVSGQIKECYNKTFKEDRILLAYELGLQETQNDQ
jgi:hypothetical protein